MLIKKLFRTAWKYKAQFISMIIMVSIGIGIFLGFNIEWYSLEMDVTSFLEDTGYADYRLYLDSGFSEEDIQAVQNIEGVKEATRYLQTNVGVKGSGDSLSLNVSENYSVSFMKLMEGEPYEEQSEGIWLSDRYAEANNIGLGDEITVTYLDKTITGEVTGLVKSGEMMICVGDKNQLMPDYKAFGYMYITPAKLESVLGKAFYPQINVITDMKKSELEEAVQKAVGQTILVIAKDEHTSYAGAMSEIEEGKTMGAILPVLFLAIGILTMVTTMHRIAANEKVQIGTLKALGFKDRRILRHYTSYGLIIGIVGTLLGVAVGYGVAAMIISPSGMMSTYLDMPDWKLYMPGFCIPVLLATIGFLTLISFLSVKKMLAGTAADALRPYTPKAMKKSIVEKLFLWKRLGFGTKWNIRDAMRHKARSSMTLIGVIGCMLLLVGGLGMKDTMDAFIKVIDEDINNYETRINISEDTANEQSMQLADRLHGDWQASAGISYEGETIVMEVYRTDNDKIHFIDEKSQLVQLSNEGVYLCQRLKDTAKIGDTIQFSPYGSEETYKVKVAGYIRSLMSECIVMTEEYAKEEGIPYHIGAIYTDEKINNIEKSPIIADKQDTKKIMDSYDGFMEIMNFMVAIFVVAAIVLGIVVLYNLGIMSYVERSRELATLKVLGFRDKKIGRLLISQNVWITVLGVVLGLPLGIVVLDIIIVSLASEYELMISMGVLTYSVSILVTFGVSLFVGWMVSKKNKHIDMVEALKGTE